MVVGNPNELYHYGVLGMKWDVRRYQPYSTTGGRKSGKKGKEIGEAAKKRNIRYLDINKSKNKAKKYLRNDEETKKYIKDISKNYNGEIAIDTTKDMMVGRILVGNKKDKGFITDLSVNASHRKLGIGNKLLDDAIKKYGGIDLTVSKENKIAIDMYKKRGFEVIKDISSNQYYMKLKIKDIL